MMKIKYLFLFLIFSDSQLFSATELLRVKFTKDGSAGKIVKAGMITESSLGSKKAFKLLVNFDRAVKEFRNSTTVDKVKSEAKNIKEALAGIIEVYKGGTYLESNRVYPYEIGKIINGKLTGLINAFVDLKKMPNPEVGFEKSLNCTLIFVDLLEKIFKTDGELKKINSCSNDLSSFGCIVLAKDDRNKSALDVAIDSGNILFVYLLHLLAKNVTNITLEDIKNNLESFTTDESKFADIVKGEYETEFSKAVGNFNKLTKFKSLDSQPSFLKKIISDFKSFFSKNNKQGVL